MGKKVVGFIGGLAWPSTVEYYRIYNEETNKILGEQATGEALVYSVNLPEFLHLAMNGKIDELTDRFEEAAKKLQSGGAGLIEICSNTMHIVFDELEKRVDVPMIHIIDATAEKAKEMGITTIGLLGTPVTMGSPFYKDRLMNKYGIKTVVPDEEHWEEVFRVIEEELTFNNIVESSRQYYLKVFENLREKGAQGVILGCTEIPLLIKQSDTDLPVFDTTELHAKAAAEWAVK